MRRTFFIVLCSGLALGACSRLGFESNRSYVSPLPAAPAGNVQSQQLAPVDLTQGNTGAQPMDGTMQDGTLPGDPAQPGTEMANAPSQPARPMTPPASSLEIGRTDLLGGWTVASAGDSCQLFMTLTTWSGGYRATTRGCNSPTLKSISAWDLNGKQVVLKNGDGGNVAMLYSSATEKFNGQTTAGGQPISIYR